MPVQMPISRYIPVPLILRESELRHPDLHPLLYSSHSGEYISNYHGVQSLQTHHNIPVLHQIPSF